MIFIIYISLFTLQLFLISSNFNSIDRSPGHIYLFGPTLAETRTPSTSSPRAHSSASGFKAHNSTLGTLSNSAIG
jgi:hypothetical protein